jgi:biotin carboxylase
MRTSPVATSPIAERGGAPHLLVVGARSEALAKLLGLPVALTVVRRPGGIGAFDESVTLRTLDTDVTDSDALLAAAREVHAWRPIDAVLGMTERSLHASSLVGEALGVRVNPSAAVALANDKSAMRRRLAECGLDATAHRVCRGLEEAEAFARTCPSGVVLKPVDGNGGTGVMLVRDPSELAAAWAWSSSASHGWVSPGPDGNTVLAEEYLTGRELSIETISAAGRHRVLAVTAKHTAGPPHFVELGHDLPAPLTPAQHAVVEAAACDALSAIGHVWGPCHTEVMLAGERATVVEINTRFGGDRIWEMVELVTGVNLPVATVTALAHGELPSAVEAGTGPGTGLASGRGRGRGAAIRFLTASPGRIIAVSGLEEARAVDGVIRIGEVKGTGHVVPPLSDSWGRVGYVLAAGAEVESAARAAEHAASHIAVRTAPDPQE